MSSIRIWLYAVIGLVGIILLHHVTYEAHAVEVPDEILDEYAITGKIITDGNIRVLIQNEVENAHEVPLVVNLPHYLYDMKAFVILVDNNPIQEVMRIEPHRRIEKIGTNIRLETTSPVRVVVLDSSNVWRIISKNVIVLTPGGCSAPSGIDHLKEADIGKMLVNLYDRRSGAFRIKTKVLHPMDTGLVLDSDGNIIPEYYIDRMEFSDEEGLIAIIETFASLSSNPMVMLDLPNKGQNVRINMRDSQGNRFYGEGL